MYLKTKELKTFLSLANPISQNNIIPILQYIKLENSSLTKTNLSTYVVHKIDAPANESLLLDEKVLSAFLKECRSDQFEVRPKGKHVYLIEGKREMKYQSADINTFPKLPDAEKGDYVEFDAELLSSLGVAAKNTGNTGLSSSFDYVHINKGYVIATDNHKIYFRKAEGMPDLVLTTECCNIISQFQDAVFYHRGRYNFFEIGNTLYGFIQSEAKTPDFTKFIPKEQPSEYIDINASEFIGFCDTVMAASASKDLSASFKGNILSFVDSELDIDYKIELQTEGTYQPDVNFIPKLFGSFFKSIGISKIRLCDSGLGNKSLSVWDVNDPSFAGIVIGTMEQ